jgi:hypothetical protein
MRRILPHIAAAGLLALLVIILFGRLLFTDRVLASGDILLYFYPYRSFAAAAFREGEIALWNPYIFSGAPFLANPQAAALYPLHWPLSWLPVTKQIYVSGALHAWILGLGGYTLLRCWGYGWLPGLVTAFTLAGSGFYGGLLGHINQMNAAAWLPWMVVVGSMDNGSSGYREGKRRPAKAWELPVSISNLIWPATFFAVLTALTLLAGHTQTAYINLFGVGLWVFVKELGIMDGRLAIGWWGDWIRRRSSFPRPILSSLIITLLIYILGVLLGGLLSAAQLLPTLELSALGLRSGGLSYWDVTSFSLQPLRLPWTLFPTYGLSDLSIVFGPAFTEFVGYVGLVPLLLGLFGFWRGRRQRAWLFGLLFVVLGLFLALGRWNPAYYILYKLVPGFDLFRTPARWMMLYTLGMAVLAGVGMERLGDWKMGGREVLRLISPSLNPITASLVLLIAIDLLLAARSLPHTQPTAPQAVYGVRTAPAHLLTDPARTLHPAAMGRFLSLSTTEFDPGDMADWQRIYRQGTEPQLDEKAFGELIIALKAQEILAPNLPLFWRVPAVDGFDGGVLPLQRYNDLMALLIPPETLVPDGRIREQLDMIPPADLLRLMGVGYVITDKVRDLWFEGIYYDRQIGATLDAGHFPAVEIEVPQSFEATMATIVGFVDGDLKTQNQIVARMEVIVDGVVIETIPLTAGGSPGGLLINSTLDSALADQAGTVVAYRDIESGRQEYLVRLTFANPVAPESLHIVHGGDPNVDVTIQAATLVDTRTETFQPLLPSDRGHFRLVHSGDVKIYEVLDGGERVYLASAVDVVSSAGEAQLQLQRGLPMGQVVVEAPAGVELAGASGSAEIIAYAPEHIVVRTQTDDPALLVLSDAIYPGWEASIDGAPAPIYPTNVLFRGVPVPAGDHEVVFTFRPQSWERGYRLSALGALLLIVTLIGFRWQRR